MSKPLTFAAALVMVLGLCLAIPGKASAHSYQRNCADEYFLRYVAYLMHPVGLAVEYVAARPAHWVASRPHADILFGHKARPSDVYFEWTHGDGSGPGGE